MKSIDLTLVDNGQWYELYKKYELYLKKALRKQDVEDGDLVGEAWLLIEKAKRNLDVSKIVEPAHWNLRPLLAYQLNGRYKKMIGSKKITGSEKTAIVNAVEPYLLDLTPDTRSNTAYENVLFNDLLKTVETKYGPRHRFMLESLTKGYTYDEIAKALGVSKQLTNMWAHKLKPVIAHYL